jgi:predicted transcriptional regulator
VALPRMDPDPTALAGAPQLQPVTTSTCVHVALAHLRNSGETAAVVCRSGRPIGLVTADALARAVVSGRADAPITTVMDYVVVPVSRDADAHATVREFTDAPGAGSRAAPSDGQPVRLPGRRQRQLARRRG